ncbi:MAG TPA: helix-turn-helix domain-containing protein [Bacillota bacterium]|nr:helix-turn-helix domain-containing protein [Bacillota bacterium]
MTRLLKADEVARILDVPRDRIYEMAYDELLPVVRMGRQIRVDEAKLKEWIDKGGKALPGGWRARPR